MGVRLLYGLKTADQGYLKIFYPSRRLFEEAAKAGIDYDGMILSPEADIAQAANFVGACAAILRGDIPEAVYLALEARGVAILNPWNAVALARDKLDAAAFFKSLGISHPDTRALHPGEKAPYPFPFVVKPRFGKMGIGVALIESEEDYRSYSHPGQIIAQEYIQNSRGRDVRFFFAAFDGQDRARTAEHPGLPGIRSACVQRKGSEFLSNAHAGAAMSWFDAPEALLHTAQVAFEESGLRYGTVDFLFAAGGRFSICELNSCPGFEELERATGLNAAAAILNTAERTEYDL